MITSVQIQNYRSIVDATVELSPFTLLIGANGTGKSNFLRLFEDLSSGERKFEKHFNHPDMIQKITVLFEDGSEKSIENGGLRGESFPNQEQMKVFRIDPNNIGKPEPLGPNPSVDNNGRGAVNVLDALKTGDREDLFALIENDFKRYIPEIDKLSFVPGSNVKQLQVREKSIEQPIRLMELSEGTRLVLTLLTIIHQENPPAFIGLEEIDRGLHPRLFQQIIELLSIISKQKNIQIVATTQNPYLVDEFKDREEAVIIVEKRESATTFTPLEERLEHLLPDEMPLGQLWYSGIIGGVPAYAR